MNWQMITVVGAVVLGVSTALWVIFSGGKDSCSYLKHYAKRGYNPDANGEHWWKTR
jgi:hypothetical protein